MKTILLVDDDPQLRTVFKLALSRKGYNVLVADSGAAALALARLHLPDLILTDIHMPGGDGSTLLQEIRRDPELASKQVVLMTGRPDLVTPRKGMEEGADDFLVKPVNLGSLITCMEARFRRASISWRVKDESLTMLQAPLPRQLPHEFFTPLAGIIGLADILITNLSGLTPDEVADIHRDIYQSALRLHRTLKNFLLILELSENEPEPSLTPLPASQVEASLQMGIDDALRLNSRRSDVTLAVRACSLLIKAEDLSRIVEELVDNACKFSRKGTPINVELDTANCLIVTDQGRGLTPDQIDKIGAFQQFERKKYEQQGLGLGLVLVQKFARASKAKFSINSHPGQGTQVQIAFAPGLT